MSFNYEKKIITIKYYFENGLKFIILLDISFYFHYYFLIKIEAFKKKTITTYRIITQF